MYFILFQQSIKQILKNFLFIFIFLFIFSYLADNFIFSFYSVIGYLEEQIKGLKLLNRFTKKLK